MIAAFRHLLAAALLGLTLWLALALVASAQDRPDYDAWERVAVRAEETLEAGRASDQALEVLRKDVVTWRESFLAAQGQNENRITTLQSQIDALGAAPDDPDSESADVAARRAELQDQLDRLTAPVVAAEEAYRRSDGIIQEIDDLIRSRRTERLLELGPSPLSPANWGKAAKALADTARDIVNETRATWASELERRVLWGNLPAVLVLAALGGVLILRGRSWMLTVTEAMRRRTRRGTGVWSFLFSIGQIVLPLTGLFLLTAAIRQTGMVGPHTDPLLQRLPIWGSGLLLVWWLGDQVFSRNDDTATIALDPAARTEARFHTGILALGMTAHAILLALAESERYPPEAAVALDFPVVVLTGLSLMRLGQLLAKRPRADAEPVAEEIGFARRLIRMLGRAAIVLGLVGPVMVAIGYSAAGTSLVYPAVGTLLVLGLLTVLQRFIFDVFRILRGDHASDQGGLFPVLAGFALFLLAMPGIALIWGARVADLTELWSRFQEGFSIGESRISPGDFLTFVIVFVIGYLLTRLVQGALRTSVLPKTRINQGAQTAILSGLGYIGIFLAAIIAITSAGIDLTALGYVAGALSVGIGFGLQNIVSNFVSGIILLIERPISKGDWIEVGGQMGYVRDIAVRATRIETFDRTDVIVPNSDFISGTVTNYTRGNTIGRVIAPVGVAYGSDVRRVESILREIAEAHPMVLANPAPNVLFKGFGADSLDFEIRAILRDVNWVMNVHSDLNHEIYRRFTEEGIEIPFAQRDLWLRNPEALREV